MGLLPLCGPPVDDYGPIPIGRSYMTPDPQRVGEGRSLAADAALAALSRAADTAYLAQLQLDDLAELLDGLGDGLRPAAAGARDACTAGRRALRTALLGITTLRDRLAAPRGGPPPPRPKPLRRRC
jgi:hypothetical protein